MSWQEASVILTEGAEQNTSPQMNGDSNKSNDIHIQKSREFEPKTSLFFSLFLELCSDSKALRAISYSKYLSTYNNSTLVATYVM